jgi:hypothetical protein
MGRGASGALWEAMLSSRISKGASSWQTSLFFVPRRPVGTVLSELPDPDEAMYFLALEGDTTSIASEFLVLTDEAFAAETTLTVALALRDNSLSDRIVVSSTTVSEHVLPVPSADESYVYAWSNPYDQIPEGDFVSVAADGVCDPMTVGERGSGIRSVSGCNLNFLGRRQYRVRQWFDHGNRRARSRALVRLDRQSRYLRSRCVRTPSSRCFPA